MKTRLVLAVVLVLLVQVGLMTLLWNSPPLKAERAFTPIPSRTPAVPPKEPTPTRIATLIPVSQSAPTRPASPLSFDVGQCSIPALDLIGAWVKAGKPDAAPFDFQDSTGKSCQATFAADVQPLFLQPNIWFGGAISCATCHGSDVKTAAGNLSLANLAGMLAGSQRKDLTAAGQDILGDGSTWEQSKLYFMIFNRVMPVGRPPTSPQHGPVVRVGLLKP